MVAKVPTAKLNTGSEIPMLGLGTWKGKDKVAEVVHTAIKIGYRHIDCAKAYGNQEDVGKGIAQAISEGIVTRQQLWITSKLWNAEHADARSAIEGTLKELGLEYLDEYIIHWPVAGNKGPTVEPPIQDTWKQMEDVYRAGLAKNIGVSNFSVQKLKDLLSYAEVQPAVNQVEVHPFWRNQKIIDFCRAHDIHVTAYSPLGTPDSENEVKRSETPSLIKEPAIKEAADKLNKNPVQILIRWGIQHGTSVIPKATSEDHLKSNFDVFDWELPAEEYDAISNLKLQRRLVDGSMFCSEDGPYTNINQLWDGEVEEESKK